MFKTKRDKQVLFLYVLMIVLIGIYGLLTDTNVNFLDSGVLALYWFYYLQKSYKEKQRHQVFLYSLLMTLTIFLSAWWVFN